MGIGLLRHHTEQLLTRGVTSLSPPVDYCDKPSPRPDESGEYRQRVQVAQYRLEERLDRNPHVMSLGRGFFGDIKDDGTDVIGVTVTVSEMVDQTAFPLEDRIPDCFRGIPMQTLLPGKLELLFRLD